MRNEGGVVLELALELVFEAGYLVSDCLWSARVSSPVMGVGVETHGARAEIGTVADAPCMMLLGEGGVVERRRVSSIVGVCRGCAVARRWVLRA